MKALLQKHLISVLCVISIIALAFPLCIVITDVSVMGFGDSARSGYNGFQAMQESLLAILLLAGPVLLIAMNYIKKLEKYQGILAIAVPVICLAALIIVCIQLGQLHVNGGDSAFLSMEVKTQIGFGAILAFLSYIATIVAGAVKFHHFTLDKAGLEKLKAEGSSLLQSTKGKVSETVQTVSAAVEAAGTKVQENLAADSTAKSTKVNLGRTEEILQLIERLAQMKDAGILTEEEFSEKKAQLLSEI